MSMVTKLNFRGFCLTALPAGCDATHQLILELVTEEYWMRMHEILQEQKRSHELAENLHLSPSLRQTWQPAQQDSNEEQVRTKQLFYCFPPTFHATLPAILLLSLLSSSCFLHSLARSNPLAACCSCLLLPSYPHPPSPVSLP